MFKLCLRSHFQSRKSFNFTSKFSNVIESKTIDFNCNAKSINEASTNNIFNSFLCIKQPTIQPQAGSSMR